MRAAALLLFYFFFASFAEATTLSTSTDPGRTTRPAPVATPATGAPATTSTAPRLHSTTESQVGAPQGQDKASNEPQTTAAPLPSAGGANVRFVQTTYWSCVTQGTYTHCGWHIPILDAGANRVFGRGGGNDRGTLAAGVAGLAGLLLGWLA
ncbi:hypothetical protein VTK73DRAFT_8677 [Phialemonium thermophilum]|uniref:Uncharacterized protein n=1 Tax=Phialemonium thermophilum TaxID=223376 RepID=A0ABR3W726_9PEZI